MLTGSARMRRYGLEPRCWGSQPTKAWGRDCTRQEKSAVAETRAKPVQAELVQNAVLDIFVYER